jgi:cytochrome c oxidase cbb3-type subunit IV
MGIEDLRGLATVLCMLAFAAIVYWAYGPSRKDYFETAAKLPFEDSDELEIIETAAAKVREDANE